ncbi:MAG TPA: GH32 C-terminal domain-containing protein [Streptomyces sp.]
MEPTAGSTSQPQSYRAAYHFTVPREWMNDPQRPVYVDGEYLYYYLFNADYSRQGNGTAWRLATTRDGVTFQDQGIAIPKFTTPNGDVWSGSAVVDAQNTAGFGKGAVVALVTQRDRANGDAQAQFLWYSTDRGRRFAPLGDRPVLPNPGSNDFRDPKVVRDDERGRWVLLLAEGRKIGFYVSQDLRSWRYTSGFTTDGIGILECPDLFLMQTDTGEATWVLGASANGKAAGLPNTYAYWTGAFDGGSFRPDTAEPQWLDHGFDWYAGVTWETYRDGRIDPTTRYALAWMNNWDYPHTTPTLKADGFNGTDSVVRQVTLRRGQTGRYVLCSRPADALGSLVASTTELGDIQVAGDRGLSFDSAAYEIQADVTWDRLDNVGMRLRTSRDGRRHVDVGVFGDHAYVNRSAAPHPPGPWTESHSPFPPGRRQVRMRVLVDRTSIEAFFDDGQYTHSHLVFPQPDDTGISLFAQGGNALFSGVRIREFTQGNTGS